MNTAAKPVHPIPHDLAAFGWDNRVAALFTMFPNRVPGRVVRVDRIRYVVATAHGQIDAQPGPLDDGSETGPPATGDWVALTAGPDERPSVAAILPRRLTKADLLEGGVNGPAVAAALQEVAEIAPGVEVMAASNVTGSGLERIRRLVSSGATIALIGESGSGKSTLINSLLDQDLQSTGATRDRDGKGRHTTTSRELIVIPGRGVVIDTPGLRSIGLWNGREGLAQAFPDIGDLAADCRFADCRHETEPGCAVRAALDHGNLDPRRLKSYRRMEREVTHQQRRLNVRKSREDLRAAGRRYRRARQGTVEW